MQKEKRTIIKQVRFTETEARTISEAAGKEKVSESKYIRRKVFSQENQMSHEVAEKLSDLNYQIRKIGININQVVRSCNEQKNITRTDFQLLVDYEKMIDGQFRKMYRMIEKIAEQECGQDSAS